MPTVLITGSNRGLGIEFARQYSGAGWNVIATCRDPVAATALQTLPGIEILQFDAGNPGAPAVLKSALGDRAIDVLIHNAGIGQQPASLGAIDYTLWQRMFDVHVIAPVRLTETLVENVKRGAQKKIVSITSGLGSFAYLTQNGPGFLGPLHPYRSTKAALNMAMRGVAADLAPQGVTVAVISPGWVRTDMGGENAPLSPEESVSKMRGTIDKLSFEKTGSFLGHDGAGIDW